MDSHMDKLLNISWHQETNAACTMNSLLIFKSWK